MELYDKKFFINGNCMIRSFGQPGIRVSRKGRGQIFEENHKYR